MVERGNTDRNLLSVVQKKKNAGWERGGGRESGCERDTNTHTHTQEEGEEVHAWEGGTKNKHTRKRTKSKKHKFSYQTSQVCKQMENGKKREFVCVYLCLVSVRERCSGEK